VALQNDKPARLNSFWPPDAKIFFYKFYYIYIHPEGSNTTV